MYRYVNLYRYITASSNSLRASDVTAMSGMLETTCDFALSSNSNSRSKESNESPRDAVGTGSFLFLYHQINSTASFQFPTPPSVPRSYVTPQNEILGS